MKKIINSQKKPLNIWIYCIISFCIGATIATIKYFPAIYVASYINKLSKLKIENVLGNIWEGSAYILIESDSAEREIFINQIKWENNIDIKNQKINLVLKNENNIIKPLEIEITLNHLKINNNRINFSMNSMQKLGSPFNTIGVTGDIFIEIKDMKINFNNFKENKGFIIGEINNFNSKLSTIKPLGNYSFSFDLSKDIENFKLNTKDGKLILDLNASINNKGFRINGEAYASKGHEDALYNLLSLIGFKNGNKTIIKM